MKRGNTDYLSVGCIASVVILNHTNIVLLITSERKDLTHVPQIKWMLEKSTFLKFLKCGPNIVSDVCVSLVSDLQEEGKYAINAPLLPASADLLPEDMLLGNILLPSHQFNSIYSLTSRSDLKTHQRYHVDFLFFLLMLHALCFQL